jgi:hypothetical protein
LQLADDLFARQVFQVGVVDLPDVESLQLHDEAKIFRGIGSKSRVDVQVTSLFAQFGKVAWPRPEADSIEKPDLRTNVAGRERDNVAVAHEPPGDWRTAEYETSDGSGSGSFKAITSSH